MQEFKIDNSTLSAEYGQSSGAVVNIATRSGTNDLHGELFEFLRNDALDARNFFDFDSERPPPFKRNQFGGHWMAPSLRTKHFFSSLMRGCASTRDSSSTVLFSAMPSGLLRLTP